MRINYVYVKDFRALHLTNFNLGGRYRFEFDPSTSILSIESNDLYIPNFFDEHILSNDSEAAVKLVSAIVGENGSGKSTFLEFIKLNFIRGAGGFRHEAIVVLEDHETGELHLYHHNSITLSTGTLQRLQELDISVTSYGPKKINPSHQLRPYFLINQAGSIPEAGDADYIFFSNIFDAKPEEAVDGLFNISTNYLLQDDISQHRDRSRRRELFNVSEKYKMSEIQRQLNFINHFREEYNAYLTFDLPTKLLVTVNNLHLLKEWQEQNSEYFKLIDNIFSILNNRKKLDKAEFFILDMVYAAILNGLQEDQQLGFDQLIPQVTERLSLQDLQLMPVELALQTILSEFDAVIPRPRGNKGFFIYLQEMIDVLFNFNNEVKNEGSLIQDANVFDFSTLESQQSFFRFYNLYIRTFRINSYLDFSWKNLSSGEEAMLSIYGRFFSLADSQVQHKAANLVLRKDLVILIDEGDLYLHPAWQKNLLGDLLQVLPVIYSSVNSKRNIQIILTSNSPLVLTDIPMSNVVFLSRSYRTRNNSIPAASIPHLDAHKQTFAANIHTLLADSFFLKDGLTGKFATKKINDVIQEMMSGKPLTTERKSVIKKIILQVGEPIIRHKLLQIFSERVNLDADERIQKIEQYLNL